MAKMTQPAAIDPLSPAVSSGDEWTVGTLMTVFRRRRPLLVWPVFVTLLLALIYCCAATPRYKATGQIQVQKDAPGAFGLESSVMGRDDGTVSSDSLDYNIMLQTEVGILQSTAMALVVIRDLHLERTHDYFPPLDASSSLVARWPGRLIFWHKPLEPQTVPLGDAPNRRYKALKIFAGHLKVLPVTGTRLVEISYADPDPVRAAAVVNRLIAELGEFAFSQRFTATLQGSSWLTGQLADLKRQMQELQAKAVALQRDTGMFGNDGSRNVVLERLDSLNQTLAQAESNRILKQAIDEVASSGDPELISSLSGNSSGGVMASMTNSLTLVQSLRTQQAALQAELAQDSVRYGPNYPRLGELRAQLGGVQTSIDEEVHRLGERAHTDYTIAAREEAGARAAFDQQKLAAGKLNDSVLAYGLAKQEADSSRDIYETLLSKLKQAGVLEGLKASNISVVSLAQVPPSDYPSSPNFLLIFAAALAAGLMMGCTLVIAVELTDDKLRSFEGMERSLGIPLIGILPSFDRFARCGELSPGWRWGKRLVRRLEYAAGSAVFTSRTPPLRLAALDDQPSIFAEGLRSLRTALLLARSGEPPQVMLVTSCLEGEGKTTLALNLAALFAQQGARVLLVDADLRKPTLSSYFPDSAADVDRGDRQGLGAALTTALPPAVLSPLKQMPNLAVLCGEEMPPFPSDLLSSVRMRELLAGWKQEYEFIILDSPPVLPVTDAILLSQVSDATLLVARHGQTTRKALKRSGEALRRQHPGRAALGMVLNDVSRDSGDFYEYFGFEGGMYVDSAGRA